MPEKGKQEASVAGIIVREAVERGLETEFRDQIVGAVEEADGGRTGSRAKTLPVAGALVGIGAAVGYLVGRGELDTTGTAFEDVDPSTIIDEVAERGADVSETVEVETDDSAETGDSAEGGRGRLLATLVLVAGAVAGIEYIRRNRSDDDEWTPIEEFEPVTEDDFGRGDDAAEEDAEEAEATIDEAAEGDAEESEATTDVGDEDEE